MTGYVYFSVAYLFLWAVPLTLAILGYRRLRSLEKRLDELQK